METRPRRISGPKSLFRGKLRTKMIQLRLTAEGHAALASGVARSAISQQDYIERLIREADARARRAEASPA